MHVLIDARMVSSQNFGISRYVVNLVKNLAKIDKDNKYTILVQNDFLAGSIKASNFECIYSQIKWLSVQEQLLLPFLVKKINPDIFHATSFVVPRIKVCKNIITIHDLIHMIFPDQYNLLHRLYYRFIVGPAVRAADQILTVSESSRKDIAKYFKVPLDKITATRLSAEENFKPQSQEAIRGIRDQYRIGEREFILYVGNRKPHKNLPTLISAFGLFKKKYKNEYFLALSGEPDEELSRLSKDSGIEDQIIFLGKVKEDDLPAVYSTAEAFVCPSLYEGFGLPVLEAMACGAPVITSNISSLPEVIGDAGIMVDPYSAEDLAEKMREISVNTALAEEMREKGLQRAKLFTWEKCALQTLKVYTGIVDSQSSI